MIEISCRERNSLKTIYKNISEDIEHKSNTDISIYYVLLIVDILEDYLKGCKKESLEYIVTTQMITTLNDLEFLNKVFDDDGLISYAHSEQYILIQAISSYIDK